MTSKSTLCQIVQRQAMTHLAHETSVLEQQRFTAHLAGCAACRASVESMSEMLEAARGERFIPTPKARDEMLDGVLARIEQDRSGESIRPTPAPRRSGRRARWVAAASMAAAAAAALIITFATQTPPTDRAPGVQPKPGAVAVAESHATPPTQQGPLDTRRLAGRLTLGVSPGARYDTQRDGARVRLTVFSGRLWVSFKPSEEIETLEVRGPGAAVHVTGTVFMVQVTPGALMSVGVLNGEVKVVPETGAPVTVGPSETRDSNGRVASMASADKEQVAGWLARLVTEGEPGKTAGANAACATPAGHDPSEASAEKAAQPAQPSDLYRQAETHMERGDYTSAAGLLERIVRAAPASSRADTARLDLATIYTRHLHNNRRAETHLKAYLRRHPNGPKAVLIEQQLDNLN